MWIRGLVESMADRSEKTNAGGTPPLPVRGGSQRTGRKLSGVLLQKNAVTETVSELIFELAGEINGEINFKPGQFARVWVGEYRWRDYSIVELDGGRVTFLVDSRFRGHGSRFISGLAVGDEVLMRLPLGGFTVANPEHSHCFIASGTGISPCIAMIRLLLDLDTPPPIHLYFGCKSRHDVVLLDRIKQHRAAHLLKITVCLSDDPPAAGMFSGRVTDAIPSLEIAPETTDFYICGNPSMVDDATEILVGKGATNLFRERY